MTAALTSYTIEVDGHLDDHWSARLGDLVIARNGDGSSTLTGQLVDQAQLHGVLVGLCKIGATIREVRSSPLLDPATSVLTRPLRTERLTLRPARPDDADATWTFRQLNSVNEWLTGCPADLDGYRDLFTDPARLATTVIVELRHPAVGPVIGDFMVRRTDASAHLGVADQATGAEAELGWILDPAHHGHGYATEAVCELVRYCFEELHVRRVTADCFLANRSSWQLMERVGMRRESHRVRDSLHRSGRWLDTLGYAILAEEWG